MANENEEYDYKMEETQGMDVVKTKQGSSPISDNTENVFFEEVITIEKVG